MARVQKGGRSNGSSLFDRYGMPKSSLDHTKPRLLSNLEIGTRASRATRLKLRENHQLPAASTSLTKDQSGILAKFHCHANIRALEQIISVVGPLIRAERTRGSRSSLSDVVNTVDDFRIRRVGTKMEFWAPILVLSGAQRQNGRKTFGFIRVKKSPFPFMASASGWTSTNRSSEDLLDSDVCRTLPHSKEQLFCLLRLYQTVVTTRVDFRSGQML